jgi:hypothetical protein
MKLFRILAIAALAMVSSASAQAGAITGVVLSNLGSDGITGSSGTSNDVIPPKAAATSFVVGASNFTLDKINIYAFGDSSSGVTGTLGIFASASGNPSSIDMTSALYTATQTMTGNDYYTFDFANPELTAGQTYWVVLRTSGTSSSWYITGDAPTTMGAGGITYGTTKISTDSASTWNSSLGHQFIAIAGSPVNNNPVPEPALTSLLCLGGVALIRRRLKK